MGKYFDLAKKHKHREMKFHGEPILVKLFSHKEYNELLSKYAAMDENKRRDTLLGLFVDPVELKPAFTAEELESAEFPNSDIELLADLFIHANVTSDPEKKG